MLQATHYPFPQWHGLRQFWRLHFRHGDLITRPFDCHSHFPQTQIMTGVDAGLCDSRTIDESAVGRIAIAHQEEVQPELDLAMVVGNGGVVDDDVVFSAATYTSDSPFQFMWTDCYAI